MIDLYLQEAESFNKLSDDCPIKILDHGLMTEMIYDKIIIARRKWRKYKKDKLIDKLNTRFLQKCLFELSDMNMVSTYNKMALHWRLGDVARKRIEEYFNVNFIPLIYLEESLKSQSEWNVLKVGDRVKCLNSTITLCYEHSSRRYITTGNRYGIITNKGPHNSFRVEFVKMRVFIDRVFRKDKELIYPDFSKIDTPIGEYIPDVELEKFGEETIGSKRLRQFEKTSSIISSNPSWNNIYWLRYV